MKKTIAQTNVNPPDPVRDGMSHINVHYKNGATKLGRMLSTYFVAPFKHPYFGPFRCVEGFMLYVKTGCVDDAFRTMTGSQAKSFYRTATENDQLKTYQVEQADEIQKLAIWAKLMHNPVIMKLFRDSDLPFDSYYLYGDGKLPIRPPDGQGLVDCLTELRKLAKAGKAPEKLSDEVYESLRVKSPPTS